MNVGRVESRPCEEEASRRERMGKAYEIFMPRVFYYLYSKLRDQAVAEDLTSIIFIKVCEKWDTYSQQKASFATWLFTITNHTLIDYYRRQKQTADIARCEHLPECTYTEDLSEPLITKQAISALESGLIHLKERERRVITLKYYHAMNNRQIASSLNINENTVATLLRRGLLKLREHLAAHKI